MTLASRLSWESGRYDRYERRGEGSQAKTEAFAIWDVVLTGHDERSRLSWAAGVYNAFGWRYALPISAEFSQRSILQDGRSLLLSADIAF